MCVCKIKPRWIAETTDEGDKSQVSDGPFQDDEQSLFEVQVLDFEGGPGPLHDPSGEVVVVEALSDEDECPDDEEIEFDSSTSSYEEEDEFNSE